MIYAICCLAAHVNEIPLPEVLIQKFYNAQNVLVATITAYAGQGIRWEFHDDMFFEECKAYDAERRKKYGLG